MAAPRASSLRSERALLPGRWKSELTADTLVVEADGRFHWGRPYSGRFSIQRNGRVIMSLCENGKLLGGMPLLLTKSGDTVRLTPTDGK